MSFYNKLVGDNQKTVAAGVKRTTAPKEQAIGEKVKNGSDLAVYKHILSKAKSDKELHKMLADHHEEMSYDHSDHSGFLDEAAKHGLARRYEKCSGAHGNLADCHRKLSRHVMLPKVLY